MGRTLAGLVAAVAGGLTLAVSARTEEPAPRATVLEATVKFGRVSDPAAKGSLRLDGDLLAGAGFDVYDPLSDGLRVALGPARPLDGVPGDGSARLKHRRDGDWVLTVRRPYGGKGKFVLHMAPGSGRYSIRASGFPAAALREAGPAAVAAEFLAGDSGGVDTIDFTAKNARKWTYQRTTPVRRPPPGSGGGGGATTPPSSGLSTLAQGAFSGITSFRFEVVRDQAAWQSLWTAHAGSGVPPAVDFSVDMVVAVFLGTRNSGGYTVTINSVTPATVIGAPCTDQGCPPGGAMALIIEGQPGWMPVPGVLTQPFHMVRAPRVEGPVLYEMVTVVQ